MKTKSIYKNIRKIYLRHLWWPMFPIIVSVIFLIVIPFGEIINPIKVSSTEDAIKAAENGYKYMEFTAERLIYSGYVYMKDTDVYGEYYYDMVNGQTCVFYLLKPMEDQADATNIYNISKKVKVIEANGIFDNMLRMFADDIGWTEEGVKSVTKNYILSEVDYHKNLYTVLWLLLMSSLIYGASVFLYNLFCAVFPMLSPKLLIAKHFHKNRKSRSMNSFIELVAREMEEPKLCVGNMYITEHFFVNMDKHDYAIVPLKKIVLAYQHSTLKSFFGIHLNVSQTLHLKCPNLLRFHAPKKTTEETDAIIEYFKENEPGIFIGYTNENRQIVKEVINKSTSWFRR